MPTDSRLSLLKDQLSIATTRRANATRTHGAESPEYAAADKIHADASRRLAEHVQGVDTGNLALPQNHDDYFDGDEATRHVAVHKIIASEDQGGGDAAESKLALAASGMGEKQEPVLLESQGDGFFKALAGAAACEVARRHGWTSIPAHVLEKGEHGELSKGVREAPKFKAQPGSSEAHAEQVWKHGCATEAANNSATSLHVLKHEGGRFDSDGAQPPTRDINKMTAVHEKNLAALKQSARGLATGIGESPEHGQRARKAAQSALSACASYSPGLSADNSLEHLHDTTDAHLGASDLWMHIPDAGRPKLSKGVYDGLSGDEKERMPRRPHALTWDQYKAQVPLVRNAGSHRGLKLADAQIMHRAAASVDPRPQEYMKFQTLGFKRQLLQQRESHLKEALAQGLSIPPHVEREARVMHPHLFGGGSLQKAVAKPVPAPAPEPPKKRGFLHSLFSKSLSEPAQQALLDHQRATLNALGSARALASAPSRETSVRHCANCERAAGTVGEVQRHLPLSARVSVDAHRRDLNCAHNSARELMRVDGKAYRGQSELDAEAGRWEERHRQALNLNHVEPMLRARDRKYAGSYEPGALTKGALFGKSANNGGSPKPSQEPDESWRIPKRFRGMSGDGDLRSNAKTVDDVLSHAREGKKSIDGALGSYAKSTGQYTAENIARDSSDFAKARSGGMAIPAPLKKAEKIRFNAEGYLRHDKDSRGFNPETDAHGEPGYNRVTDAYRGSVAVPHQADIPHAIAHLHKHLKAHGLEIVSAKDRFNEPGPSGYGDVNLRVKHKNGHYGEIQIHTLDMLEAKEHARYGHRPGHAMYDTVNAAKKNQAENKAAGRPDDPHLEAKVDEAMAKSRHLYGHEALKAERARVPHFEKDPAAIRRADASIVTMNHKIHAHGPMERPDGSIERKRFE